MLLRRAGPEDSVLLFDLFISDAGIIDNATLRCLTQLFKNFTGGVERKTALPTERFGYVLDYAPVLPGVTGRLNRLVDLDDATFDLRDDTFVLFLKRPGEHYVCVMCRLAEEEIYGNVKLELFKGLPYKTVVRQ